MGTSPKTPGEVVVVLPLWSLVARYPFANSLSVAMILSRRNELLNGDEMTSPKR